MKALFAISMLSFAALLWVVLAFARRLKAARVIATQPSGTPPRGNFRHHFVTALQHRSAPDTSLNQSLADIAAHKVWDLPSEQRKGGRRQPKASATLSINPDLKKPPAPASYPELKRVDWACFSKDPGDLTDPFQPQSSSHYPFRRYSA